MTKNTKKEIIDETNAPSETELDIEKTRGIIHSLNDLLGTTGWQLLEKLFKEEMGEWIDKMFSADNMIDVTRAQASIAIIQSIVGKPELNIKELEEYMKVLKANDRTSGDIQKEMGENITQYLKEQNIVK